jgi:transcriptional regulator GlxA family with amidase domain
VNEARQWIDELLQQRFKVVELSRTVGASPRQLGYHLLQELEMAVAKRMRLQRLSNVSMIGARAPCSVAVLTEASGLIALGATSADCRQRFGESPPQTRRRSIDLP